MQSQGNKQLWCPSLNLINQAKAQFPLKHATGRDACQMLRQWDVACDANGSSQLKRSLLYRSCGIEAVLYVTRKMFEIFRGIVQEI